MLTLDTLRKMAARMPDELGEAEPRPPYGRADAGQPRRVTLPSVQEETRRALAMFAFFVGAAVSVLTTAGLLCTFGGALADGVMPTGAAVLATALWYAGWSAAFAAPFAAFGLWREVRRYRAARELLGPVAWLDPAGWLWSEDRTRRYALTSAGRG